jgi:hypothetical protein
MRRLLFDTGITPGGCAGNLRRLGQDLAGIEAIVCSHGHFDHTTGLSSLIGQLGRAEMPVLIHPEFWARHRLAIPGGEPFELPATSRSALEDAGFDVIEQRLPTFLYDRSALITGRSTGSPGFEKGFPGLAQRGQVHAVAHRQGGMPPVAVAALVDRGDAEHNLLAQRTRDPRPDQCAHQHRAGRHHRGQATGVQRQREGALAEGRAR